MTFAYHSTLIVIILWAWLDSFIGTKTLPRTTDINANIFIISMVAAASTRENSSLTTEEAESTHGLLIQTLFTAHFLSRFYMEYSIFFWIFWNITGGEMGGGGGSTIHMERAFFHVHRLQSSALRVFLMHTRNFW